MYEHFIYAISLIVPRFVSRKYVVLSQHFYLGDPVYYSVYYLIMGRRPHPKAVYNPYSIVSRLDYSHLWADIARYLLYCSSSY